MNEKPVNTMRIENIGFGNLKLKQDPKGFCYGIDAVILADFAVSAGGEFDTVLDMGTGTGIIPFIMSHKTGNNRLRVVGIDVQKAYVDMASESCEMNGLTGRIKFIHMDVKDAAEPGGLRRIGEKSLWPDIAENGGFDVVTSNPPYVAKESGIISGRSEKFIARHETTADIEDFIKAASRVLKDRGKFFMVHRPSRLADIMYYCRKYMLEPKLLRMVSPEEGEAPNIALVQCVRGGGRELKVMKNLYVYKKRGEYSDEINRIYERAEKIRY